ncbi:MAG TPA: DUF2065 domain-containing protein [Steroidobacteraceae bacterium]|nr:DUF2065 domain-containing protein [Steroidobacteraceae bacterium]
MGLDWTDLIAALAIVCIIEGVMPFINPSGMKRLLERISSLEERQMRIAGFVSMAVGLTILFLVRS